jgi:hypothetical protein
MSAAGMTLSHASSQAGTVIEYADTRMTAWGGCRP